MSPWNANRVTMSEAEIKSAVEQLATWRHQIDLGHGVVTPGREDSQSDLSRIRLPADLSGQRVLDIGCSDGFFSFEAEKRNALEIVAIDDFSSTPFNQGVNGFTIAANILGSKAKLIRGSVYELSVDQQGQFDLVMFLNTLYHLKHPLLALERIAGVMKSGAVLLLKTYYHQDVRLLRWGFDISNRPAMRFYPGKELDGDASNWWSPNRRCLESLLHTSGFDTVERLADWRNRLYYRCIRS